MSDWNGIPADWGKNHYRDVPICKWAKLARERQQKNLQQWIDNDLEFPFYWDEGAADHVVRFFSLLRHFDGEWAGQPFKLEDWQEWDIIRPLFGWKRRDNQARRFQSALVYICRRNGKSMLASGIGLYLMIGDGEFGAQVYAAATKEDQARIVWNAAINSATQFGSPLSSELKHNKKSLFSEFLGSSFKPLGRDSKTQDGFSVHGGIIDEWHAHKDTKMRDVLASGRGSRKNPLLFTITTAGYGGPQSPCEKERHIGEQVLLGLIKSESYFCYITSVDDPEKWQDPIEWQKANPNLGISIYPHIFQSAYEEAVADPEKQAEFKTKNLNIPLVDVGTPYITLDAWNKCGEPFDSNFLKDYPCCAGLDLGITEDLSAFIAAFKVDNDLEPDKPYIYLLGRYWIPEEGIAAKQERDQVNYQTWVDQGLMIVTPGPTTRRDFIRRDINQFGTDFKIKSIHADQSHAVELMTNLSDDGFLVEKHPQSRFAMNFPVRALKELVLEGRLRHGGDPILAWSISNAVIEKDALENMRLAKHLSKDRIDGVVAAVMGVGACLIAPEEPTVEYVVMTA